MVATTDILGLVLGEDTPIDRLLFRCIWYSVNGIIMGFFGWSHWEAKYKKALLEAGVKASPDGSALPHSQAKQISN
jgi:hypothetical protein